MRALCRASLAFVLVPALALGQQALTSATGQHDKTFLTRRDFLVLGVGAAATGVLSLFDGR